MLESLRLSTSRRAAPGQASRRRLHHHRRHQCRRSCPGAPPSPAPLKLARVEAAQETLRGATQNLFALVNLRVGHAANETNRTIKQISLILAITTPLTLVASIFGMNVYPLTAVHVVDRSKEGWGLMAVLIALMVGTTCGLLLEARRREMFKAPRPAKSFS